MSLYSRDAAERLLATATRATEIVETDSAHLAELAEAIIDLHDRLEAPPRVIRTREELAELDPDTLVIPGTALTHGWQTCYEKPTYRAADAHRLDLTRSGPVVVITTGDHARAAQQASKDTE